MLSCSCDYEDDNWYYYHPSNFTIFRWKRRKRCCSCNKLICTNSICVEFNRYRQSKCVIEEKIHGGEISLASYFMCEKCGEIYFNLSELNYCIYLGDDMRQLLSEYWNITGFKKGTE